MNKRNDTDLLAVYVSGMQDTTKAHAAFAEIVSRYGGMVYQTCLRVLKNQAQAEDASQAVFVVLTQKAKFIHGSLGVYLHNVAVNVAQNIRNANQLRARHEREAAMLNVTMKSEENVRAAFWSRIRGMVQNWPKTGNKSNSISICH